jgi:transcriptional antiterminator Rof (Rho-off)
MPQEIKAMPASLDADGSTAAAHDLQGWIPPLASEAEIRDALEKAFDYRGDVTLTLKDGSTIEGYIFDRSTGSALSQCQVRLFLKAGDQKIAVAYDQIAALAFSGRDTAAGKSFETWVKKYRQKKAAGEKNVGIEPEALD